MTRVVQSEVGAAKLLRLLRFIQKLIDSTDVTRCGARSLCRGHTTRLYGWSGERDVICFSEKPIISEVPRSALNTFLHTQLWIKTWYITLFLLFRSFSFGHPVSPPPLG